jgi:DNA-binding NarL/FixJ family response regulator
MHGTNPARLGTPSGGPLTASERRVATLVAEGRTNPGVARALGLTPRALELRLSRIYRKLGVSTRRELEAVLTHLDSEPEEA